MIESFVILFCTIGGFVIAYLTFKHSTVTEVSDRRSFLLHKLEYLDSLNKELVTLLDEFIAYNNGYDYEISPDGVTWGQLLNQYRRVREVVLTEEIYNIAKSAKRLPKEHYENIIKHLEPQIEAHLQMLNLYKLHIQDKGLSPPSKL